MEKIITWDEPKRQANIVKHGLDFADLTLEFFAVATVIKTHSNRYAAIGSFVNGVVTTIYAELGKEAITVISLRPASNKERQIHEETV